MEEKIVKNEIFIRGMLVGRHVKDNRVIAVISVFSQNKEHQSYHYVTFTGEQKEIVEKMNICDKVVVTASAWIFRDKDGENKFVNSDNLRLRGKSIELSRDFTKRVIASIGIPIYGFQMIDCARFAFSGTILSINKTKNNKASLLLSVDEEDRAGFNIIPLFYAGHGEDDVNQVLEKYKKGSVVSVKGFISQRCVEVEKEDGTTMKTYKNTYFITSFLTSEMIPDYDDMD